MVVRERRGDDYGAGRRRERPCPRRRAGNQDLPTLTCPQVRSPYAGAVACIVLDWSGFRWHDLHQDVGEARSRRSDSCRCLRRGTSFSRQSFVLRSARELRRRAMACRDLDGSRSAHLGWRHVDRRLRTLPVPSELPARRLPSERRIHGLRSTIPAPAVTHVVRGPGGDVRLVLRQGSDSIVAVIPSPRCVAGATSLRRRQMGRARSAVHQCDQAFVTGVAYYSRSRGRIALELRPLLDFGCL